MNKSEIEEVLHKIIVNEMGFGVPFEGCSLESLGMDSLDVMELINVCEEKFHIELPYSSINSSTLVEEIVNIIYGIKN